MKYFLVIIFMLAATMVSAQNLELVESLHYTKAFSASECRKDLNGNFCAVIDVVLPGVNISKIDCHYKINEEIKLENGVRFFVSVPNKPIKARVITEDFQPYEFEIKDVKGLELYEIRLKNPHTAHKQQPEIVERIVEKENIVEVESSDQNTGKAYLILKISETGTQVKVDYRTYNVNGREFKINLPYGYHNVTVSKPTFRTVDFSVNLTGEPIEKNITLTNASVEIKVEKEYDAVLYVDGVRYGTQNTVRVSADSKHTIKIEKNGHTKSKTVKAEQYNFTVVMPSFSNSQVSQSNWFIGGTFSPQLMSGGISVGRCERAGFILNAGVSKLAVNNWHYRSLEKGGLLDTFKISNIYSTKLLDNSELKSAKKKGLYRSYVRIGPMFRLFDFAYIYGAVGCGTYADVKEYDSYLYAPSKHSGFEGEVGLMLKYKSLGVSAGYTQSIGKGKDFSDYHIGLNYWMNVLTKHINPRHRFIVGYRYSPSAPIGMSLGVSFGYYEQWGLVVNGGFAQYNMHVWAERSKDYSPEGFWIDEVHTVSHTYQYEGENCKHNGIFRAYYHIGPFFRINDVFSYYVTVGYGNYAHMKRHPYLTYSILSGTTNLYATKVHNGVDGEVGIMLKFGRIGFSLGYQHNIGKEDLFSDLNVGVQLWLGR